MACKFWGFCDLSINRKFDLTKLEHIEKLGYHTIAINTHVEEASDEPKKKKKRGEVKDKKDLIPLPLEIADEIKENSKLNILQRVTIEFCDSSIAHKLNSSENLKKYDIVAVVPKTLQAFQYASGSMDIDIISPETEGRTTYKISRKLYRQAVDRGVFFELMYAPAIRDSTARKNIIATAHNYHAIGKSKNIIITSGAESPLYVRDVHDVINLGFIFGLNTNQSLDVLRNESRRLILKAQGRRSGKLYVSVNKIDETNETKNNS